MGSGQPPFAAETVKLFLLGLAPDGVYQLLGLAPSDGGLLPRLFTSHSMPQAAQGGLFSAALSIPAVAGPLFITRHPVLRCPDFPHGNFFPRDYPVFFPDQKIRFGSICGTKSFPFQDRSVHMCGVRGDRDVGNIRT